MPLTSLKKVVRRKPAVEATPEPVVLTKEGGKGKITPKRAEARAGRPVTPYMQTSANPKGGARGGGGKEARRATAGDVRAALRGEGSGPLPLRDRAPERGLARQVVDGRRNLTTLVFAIYLLFFASGLAGRGVVASGLFALMIVLLLVVVGDSLLLVRLVRQSVRAAYPESKVKTGFYAVQRALLPRRFRLPRPGVGVPAPPRR